MWKLSGETHRLTPAVAILNPVQVNHAEGGGGNAGRPVVIILIDVQVEGGITVHVVRPKTRPQSLLNSLIGQPLVQLRRSTHVIDDALFEETSMTFPNQEHGAQIQSF